MTFSIPPSFAGLKARVDMDDQGRCGLPLHAPAQVVHRAGHRRVAQTAYAGIRSHLPAFEWILLEETWHTGRALLIGDAPHATTAHMGIGGGMALEDAVVLAQCVDKASTLEEALETFMARRLPRVRQVVESSVKLSHLEQSKAPPGANRALINAAFEAIAAPY